MQSINGNRRKGTNMDNEMIEKSSENCSESSCCCGTRHKKRTVQSSAASIELNSFNKVLLGCHIRSCVAEDIRSGKDETVDELCELLQRLMK